MKFKAKKFKLGHGYAIYLPKSIYDILEKDKEYDFEVYTNGEIHPIQKPQQNEYIQRERSEEIEESQIVPDDSIKRSFEFQEE